MSAAGEREGLPAPYRLQKRNDFLPMISNVKIAVTHNLRARIAYELVMGLYKMRLSGGSELTVSLGVGNSRLGGLSAPQLLESHEFDLAFLNPSAISNLALNGIEPYAKKIAIRCLAIFPSWDRLGFAVKKSLGVNSLADIAERKIPLKLSTRIQGPYGTSEFMLRKILSLCGWSFEALESWGGQVAGVPYPEHHSRYEGLKRGAYDAVFDEGIRHWADIVLDQEMTFLPLDGSVLAEMEGMGFRRAVVPKARFRGLAKDVSTIDFSGWPLFCREDFPEEDAYTIVKAIDEQKSSIPIDGDNLDMKNLCRDTEGGPLCIPLHPGAKMFYRERGYLV